MTPRHVFIRLISPWIWRLWPARQIEALQEFSAIEKDSGCQLLHCQNRLQDARLKGYLFQHVLEEFYHGELFAAAAGALANRHLHEKMLPRESVPLYEGAKDNLKDFFAYVQVGEQAVNRDFMVYARTRLDPKIKTVFAKAGMDEGRHENDTGDILFELCGRSRGRFFLAVGKAKLKRFWNLYKRAMQSVGSVSLTAILGAVYFLTGPLAGPVLRKRLRASRANELEFFRAQAAEFEAEHRSDPA